MRIFHALIGLFIAFSVGSASAQEVTMRAVAPIPKNHPVLAQSVAWVNDINAAMKGKFQINYVGGPEVIPRNQLAESVRTGVIGVAVIFAADYKDRLPSAPAFTLSRLSPSEERTSGFYDYMVDAHKKIGVRYLGRLQMGPFYVWLTKDAKSVAALKGRKMRSAPLYEGFMRKFGMIPVTMNSPEVFTALQGGVVEGLAWSGITGVRSQGWTKHVKYAIDMPFFAASNTVAIMNMDKWNGLPAATRKQIEEITAAREPKMVDHFMGLVRKDKQATIADDGVNWIKFSAADNKQYLDTIYGVEWEALAKKLPAADVAKLKKISGN